MSWRCKNKQETEGNKVIPKQRGLLARLWKRLSLSRSRSKLFFRVSIDCTMRVEYKQYPAPRDKKAGSPVTLLKKDRTAAAKKQRSPVYCKYSSAGSMVWL